MLELHNVTIGQQIRGLSATVSEGNVLSIMGSQGNRDQRLYVSGAVTHSVPLMDHGAAKNRYAAAQAWVEREESALNEAERSLREDVTSTLHNINTYRLLLERTTQTMTMADEVFELNAENYANGLCDINTYTLAQNRRDEAYNQYLSALEKYWTTYYHLLTLIGKN